MNKESVLGVIRKVSHLVEVFPVTFPYGPPGPEDVDHCVLRDNGEFVVTKRLPQQQQDSSVAVTEQLPQNKYEMTQELLDKTLEYKKSNYQIHQEYFQTQYIYEKNEDKKEFRYKGDDNVGYDKIWH